MTREGRKTKAGMSREIFDAPYAPAFYQVVSRGILQCMLKRYEREGIVWVDLESPTAREVEEVASEFGIEATIADELLMPSARPLADIQERYIYLILHFPALHHSLKSREQEVDFIIGADFLITAHYDIVDSLHKFSKVFEVNTALGKESFGHGGLIFFYLLRKLYKAIEHELEHIRKQQRMIEDHIFSGHEVRMVEAISRTARDLLSLRQTIEPHRDVLRSLEEGGGALFGSELSVFLRTLSNEYFRVHGHIMRSIESLHELRETNNSLLTTKQNETMRVFTIMAFFTFPLALMVAILDSRALGNPVETMQHGFWVIIGAVATALALMYALFKIKKWL